MPCLSSPKTNGLFLFYFQKMQGNEKEVPTAEEMRELKNAGRNAHTNLCQMQVTMAFCCSLKKLIATVVHFILDC